MRMTAFITGVLAALSSLSFLYLGNVIESFNRHGLSVALAIVFEVSFLLSSIVFIAVMLKEKRRFFLFLTIVCLIAFIGHLVVTATLGFQKAYSYGMDALIAAVYIVMLSRNYETLVKPKSN